MEFETRVTNERDFEELRKYAIYSSEITKVMVFDQSAFTRGIVLLDKYFKISDNSQINAEDMKYIIDIDDHKKIFIIAPDSYIAFCSGVKPKGSTVGFVNMSSIREIYILLKAGLIVPTNNFIEWFSPIGEDAPLCNLRSFLNRKEFRKERAWTFEKYFRKEINEGRIKKDINELTPSNTNIFKIEEIKPNIQNEIRGRVLDINYKGRKAQIETANGTIQVECHGWHPFSLGWNKGSEIRLLYKKLYGTGDYHKIIDPTILPEDIKIDNKEAFFTDFIFISNRKYPIELLNRMYYEYKMRRLLYDRINNKEIKSSSTIDNN